MSQSVGPDNKKKGRVDGLSAISQMKYLENNYQPTDVVVEPMAADSSAWGD